MSNESEELLRKSKEIWMWRAWYIKNYMNNKTDKEKYIFANLSSTLFHGKEPPDIQEEYWSIERFNPMTGMAQTL